jgi:hypothetical protein
MPSQTKLQRFSVEVTKVAPAFAVISLLVHVWAWSRHAGPIDFLNHAFLYQVPVILLLGACASLRALQASITPAPLTPPVQAPLHVPTFSDFLDEGFSDTPPDIPEDTGPIFEGDAHSLEDDTPAFNSANGLPMFDSMIDIHGNLYGTSDSD